MRFKILPLEERIVLDAALAPTIHGIIDDVSQTDTLSSANPTFLETNDMATVGNDLYYHTNETDVMWKVSSTGNTQEIDLSTIIVAGSPDVPNNFTSANGQLFFHYKDKLWVTTDGTNFDELHASRSFQFFDQPVAIDNYVYFISNTSELWRTDGTIAGTTLVRGNMGDGFAVSNGNLTNVNGTLFFIGSDFAHGVELWKSDGTETGTTLVEDITPGPSSTNIFVVSPTARLPVQGDHLIFTIDTPGGDFTMDQLWKSDGTELGTEFIINVNTGIENPTIVGDYIFFAADTSATPGMELWISDGTGTGTHQINGFSEGSFNIIDYNGTALFSTSNGGFKLWTYNPALDASPSVLKTDLFIGSTAAIIGDDLYFLAQHDTVETSFYRTDGTTEGTQLISDNTSLLLGGLTNLVNLNDTLVGVGPIDSNNIEIWSGLVTVNLPIESSSVDIPAYLAPFATDPQGDPIHYILDVPPSFGTISFDGNGHILSYTPTTLGPNQIDSIIIHASDGTNEGNLAKITFQYSLANDDSYNTNEDTQIIIDAAGGVQANDQVPDGFAVDLNTVVLPQHGTLNINADGSFNYTPVENYFGSDSFSYQLTNGSSSTNFATVNLSIQAVNDIPLANNDSYQLNEDTPTLMTPLVDDVDPDGPNALSLSISTGPLHGTLIFKGNGTYEYTPSADYHGMDSFTYFVNDGIENSNLATVSITIDPVSDAPDAVNDLYKIKTQTTTLKVAKSAGVLTNDIEADGQALTAKLLTKPKKGSVTFKSDGSFTYKPNSKFKATDTFTYLASDGQFTDTATVTIKLKGKAALSTTSSTMAMPIRSVTPVEADVIPTSPSWFEKLYEKWFR